MKKYILGILAICLFTGNLLAQPKGDVHPKLKAQKIAYITSRLDLTPEEAAIFWPIYNQYEKDRKAIKQKYRPKNKKRIPNMSDQELEQFIATSFQQEQEQLDLKKAFFNKMKKKFPIQKIALLLRAEKQFKMEVLKKWKNKRKKGLKH
ncbi:MAG TPA: hypothetical protein ENJ53_03195 [Phaeodactylibacter sp.]|nr:hypothetical protein [Phaeodactylibacter sp.]